MWTLITVGLFIGITGVGVAVYWITKRWFRDSTG